MSLGGRWPRRGLRVDFEGGSEGREFGRAEWERIYLGEVAQAGDYAGG